MGTDSIYTHTVAYERDPNCPMCSAGVPLQVSPSATLQQVRRPRHHHVTERLSARPHSGLIHRQGTAFTVFRSPACKAKHTPPLPSSPPHERKAFYTPTQKHVSIAFHDVHDPRLYGR